jgi:hypothetical protein
MKPIYAEDVKTLDYIIKECDKLGQVKLTDLFKSKESYLNKMAIIEKYKWFCEVIEEHGIANVEYEPEEILITEIPLHTSNFIKSGGFKHLHETEMEHVKFEDRLSEVEHALESLAKHYQILIRWIIAASIISLCISFITLLK